MNSGKASPGPSEESVPKSGRRGFLKMSAAVAGISATAGSGLFTPGPASAAPVSAKERPPADSGRPGRRYVIRGGIVMSMDPRVGNFEKADVLVEGTKIVDISPRIHAPTAGEIDARGRIVMPGFVDGHHHQFEAGIRGLLPNALLWDDGSGTIGEQPSYATFIINNMLKHWRVEDTYIGVLYSGVTQLDAGVTTVFDSGQMHHSPDHTDASIQAMIDTERRAILQYTEGLGPDARYPEDAFRIKDRWFSSEDQLVTMAMGGEFYIGGSAAPPERWTRAWEIGRELGIKIAAHYVSSAQQRLLLDDLAQGRGGSNGNLGIGPDNIFFHMTGASDMAWERIRDVGATSVIAVPVEMAMRHGLPPLYKMSQLGLEPGLGSDADFGMAEDFFTQMRHALTLQRQEVNQRVLEQGDFTPPNHYPVPDPSLPSLYTVEDVLRFSTSHGAKVVGLDRKTGSLTPGKEADIILLDTTKPNVTPLNHVPGAVVELMDRTNVETVIVAGKIKKWKGELLDIEFNQLTRQIEESRDYLLEQVGMEKDLFRGSWVPTAD